MALSVPKAPGISQMLKDGARVSIMFTYMLRVDVIFVYFIKKIDSKSSHYRVGLYGFCTMTHVRLE